MGNKKIGGWGAIDRGGYCPRGAIVRGLLSGGYCPGGNGPGGYCPRSQFTTCRYTAFT